MVDCGMYQGKPELMERNYVRPPVDWSEVDAILLTHAHIDHCGLIPRAVKLGFSGPVFATPATADITNIMLADSAEIQIGDAEWLSRKRVRAGKAPVEPLYDEKDAEAALRRFKLIEYEDEREIYPGIIAEYRDAGHILGSASIRLSCSDSDGNRKIVFSGDVGHWPAPILKDPVGFEHADIVLCESTYGNRLHDDVSKRKSRMTEIVKEAYKHKAKVVIPSFAVGRTQEVLYILGELMTANSIPRIPIYLDSPMAAEATSVHERHPDCYDKETVERILKHDNPFKPDSLHISKSVKDSIRINRRKGPMIIIAGGGMCEGGRIQHHLKHSLWDQKNHIVFVGYQASGTTGRAILNGAKKVRLFGEEIAVKANLHTIGAFSAHADRDGLIDWLENFQNPPGAVFLVHGEPDAAKSFKAHIEKTIGYNTIIPELDQVVKISKSGKALVTTSEKTSDRTPGASDVKEIIARVESRGDEFRSEVEAYATDLGRRIQDSMMSGREPHWKVDEAKEILSHISEVLNIELEKLSSLDKTSEK
jgi:metallo-beta-lactamase family protein